MKKLKLITRYAFGLIFAFTIAFGLVSKVDTHEAAQIELTSLGSAEAQGEEQRYCYFFYGGTCGSGGTVVCGPCP